MKKKHAKLPGMQRAKALDKESKQISIFIVIYKMCLH